MSAPVCPLPAEAREVIERGHGGGGALTARLVEELFLPAFGPPPQMPLHDGATLVAGEARLAFTTDSFVVTPLEFPGGDIGALAVIGTVNDLAMCGAQPLYLSAGFILEEGLELALLRRIAASMGRAAAAAGVGLIPPDVMVGPQDVRPGDIVLLSGDVGRHGIAIMAAREGLGFEPPVASDLACLAPTVAALRAAGVSVHCLHDLTRGGLATALVEIARAAGVELRLDAGAVAVSEAAQGACELLGLDPWYVANEGRLVAFVPEAEAARALTILRDHPGGAAAAIVGRVVAASNRGRVLAETIGGSRELDLPNGEQLPRIC